jgi:hypothetical protein
MRGGADLKQHRRSRHYASDMKEPGVIASIPG